MIYLVFDIEYLQVLYTYRSFIYFNMFSVNIMLNIN